MSKLDRFMVSPWPIVILVALMLLIILGPSCSARVVIRSTPITQESPAEDER